MRGGGERVNGYYQSNNSQNGVLSISVTNITEFEDLLRQAEKDTKALQETINALKRFDVKVNVSCEKTTTVDGGIK